MPEVMQARQKASLDEQDPSLGNNEKKERCMSNESKSQVTWAEYRYAACHSREKIPAAKAQLELELARIVKRFFFKYTNGNRQLVILQWPTMPL